MKKEIMRRACSGLLTAALVLTTAVAPGTATWAASTPRDVKGHWAQKYIEKAITAGIVSGYQDGSFRPNSPVNRAEFSHMINATLGNNATASLSFKDVSSKEWYYNDISKAVAAGYVSGYSDNTFRPEQRITRQEAAVMLSRVIPISGSNKSLSKYADYKNIESWARPSMEYIVGKGYIGTYSDGRIHPMDNMTRGQAATIIINILSGETIVKTDPNVTKDGTKLSNTIYSNNVTIDRNLGTGSATLTNCVILGSLNVQGGDSVTLNDCRVARTDLQKSSGTAQVIAKSNTTIKNTSVANTASLQAGSLSGDSTYGAGFENVSVAKNAQLTLRGAFPSVNLDGASANVTLSSGKINTLNVNSAAKESNITVESGASVAQANVSAESYFHGMGSINKMAANANRITYEKKPGTVTVGSGVTKKPEQVDAGLSISPNPSNGKTGVKVDSDIKLTFNSPVKLHNGTSIGRSDIKSFVELRRKTSTGTKESFSASIDSARKVITITPDSNLDPNTKYYIVIGKNELKDADGNSNSAFSSFFTTTDKSSGYITFTPKNGATGVSLTKDLTVRFSEKMMNYDGSTIGNRDLSDIVTLRRGSSSSGSKVPFTASIDSSKREITIDPDSKLAEGTKYYLAILSKSLKTASDKNIVPGDSITFTTTGSEVSDYCTFYPKNRATSVSRSVRPTLTFSERMVSYDKSTISNSDLRDIVSFRNTTLGQNVPFSASINSSKTQITVVPSSSLAEGSNYTLTLNSKAVRTAANYTSVPSASVSWSTAGTLPSASLTVSANEDTLTVSASGTLAGTIYAVLLPGNASNPSDSQIISGKDAGGNPALNRLSAAVNANVSKELGKFTALTPNTSYKVCAVLDPSSSSYTNSAVVYKTVSTADKPGSRLETLSVTYGGKENNISLSAGRTDYTAEVPFGTTEVTIAASTAGGNTKIENGSLEGGVTQKQVSVRGGNNKFNIVSNKSGLYDTTYTLTIRVKGNTDLRSVTAGSENLTASGTVYSYEIPADMDSVDITIESADSDADISSGQKGQGTLKLAGISLGQTINFTVTSNDDEKSYSLVITKASKPDPTPDPTPDSTPDSGTATGSGINGTNSGSSPSKATDSGINIDETTGVSMR